MSRLISLVLLWTVVGTGSVRDLSSAQMLEVVRLARLIAFSQPNLHSSKYFEYAYGILMASHTYQIDPVLMVAITLQETSFRENLPEGRAGEIGICQIRKNWLRNTLFIKEFGRIKVKDLRNPTKSFLFAAWILKDIKVIERPSRTLPFWSFYNSRTFENRLKYFLSVNRTLVRLRRIEPELGDRSLAHAQNLSKKMRGNRVATRQSAPQQASVAD